MARLILFLVSSASILGVLKSEPGYCQRGMKVSEAYQHCFEEAHFMFPYPPLRESHEIYDGCMVEAYATHTCSVVKAAALECFKEKVKGCRDKAMLISIADESGGACYGNRLNWDFKEHVLNLLDPVRGDSRCFDLSDEAYDCYSHAGMAMVEENPNLNILSVDEFIPVANQFFDNIYNCYIAVYSSNTRNCENWQIPLLLNLQGTALPSLFGMHFTPEQMDRLELRRECQTLHGYHQYGQMPHERICVSKPGTSGSNDSNIDNNNGDTDNKPDTDLQQIVQQQIHDSTLPPVIQRLRDQHKKKQQLLQQQLQQHLEDNTLPPAIQQLRQRKPRQANPFERMLKRLRD